MGVQSFPVVCKVSSGGISFAPLENLGLALASNSFWDKNPIFHGGKNENNKVFPRVFFSGKIFKPKPDTMPNPLRYTYLKCLWKSLEFAQES